jgi:pimeloyl-ACP methyl ester carboxylesterase
MNTNELLANWSTLSFEEIEVRLATAADEQAVDQLFGAQEASEMRALSQEPEPRGAREAVVLLPGVMGSLLTSIRGVTSLLWINPLLFLKGQGHYLELNEDGTRDGSPGIEAVPLALEKLVYTKIALALRRQCDLYEFPYDWRRPMEWNGTLLHDSLERWADGNPQKRFTLVGHSMGGLISRAYMALHPQTAERRIKRLIMHGTPHFGAAGAVENLIKGNRMMALAAKLNDRNVPSRLLLNMPSVYPLLPAPPDLFAPQRPYPANWDLYDANAWQLKGLRQDYLDAGKGFHKFLADADPQVETIQIAGCNVETIVEMQRTTDTGDEPEYAVIRQEEGPDGGDGTVPLWSALLPGATIYYIQEVHRYLPKNKQVIQATLDLIHHGQPSLHAALPPPKAGFFARAAEEPVDLAAARLRQQIEEGTATADDLEQLYFAF